MDKNAKNKIEEVISSSGWKEEDEKRNNLET